MGLRPGTHPASIILPEVVVPPAIRAPRIVHSPIPDDEDSADNVPASPEVELAVDTEKDLNSVAGEKPARKRHRSRSHRKKESSAGPKASSSSPHRPVVMLTVPPLTAVVGTTDVVPSVDIPDIPDDEPRYCYCNGVSAGDVGILPLDMSYNDS